MPILSVAFPFSESNEIRDGITFPSLRAANAYLRQTNPPKLGYYKTDFVVTFDDGQEYRGRFDIGDDQPNLQSHVRAFCDMVLRTESMMKKSLDKNAEEKAYWVDMDRRFSFAELHE